MDPGPLYFLPESGEMAERMREAKWADAPLGAPDAWHPLLKSMLGLCLHSSFPSALYWGPDLVLLYNDAWAPIPAERHPWALGRPAREVWADIWEVVGPQMEGVMASGRGFSTFDQWLPMEREGLRQDTWWNYSFTPILDEAGRVLGIFNQGHEVTERLLHERRQDYLLRLSDRLNLSSDPAEMIRDAQRLLGEHLGANRVGYGEVDGSERWFTTADNWTDGVPAHHGTHDLAGFGPEIHAALKRGEPLVLGDVGEDERTRDPAVRSAFAAIETQAALTTSLVRDGKMVAALYVHSSRPRHWSAHEIAVVADTAERTWAALQRAQAEAALARSEERLRLAVDGAQLGLWDWDLRAVRAWWSPRTRAMMGVPADVEVTPELRVSMVHPEDRQALQEALASALREGSEFAHDYRIVRPDGAVRHLASRGTIRRDETGKAVQATGIVMDLTEERAAADALLESEARLRAVYQAVPVGILMAEAPSGRIVGGNEEVERVFGHRLLPSAGVDAYGEWVSCHVDGRPVKPEEYPLSRALRGEEERPELEVLYRHGSGTDRWIRLVAAPVRDEAGEITGAVVAALDIDRKKRAEAALQRLNAALEQAVAQRTAERDRMWRLSTDIMLVADFEGRIHAVNPAWTHLLGWSGEDLDGQSLLDLVHPDDRAATQAEMGTLEKGVTTFRFTNRYRCRDGGWRWISWTAVPGDGLIHAIGRDITAETQAAMELEKAQEALRQSQKLEAMGQLTGGVAHDFNNLLSPIIGGLDLLQRKEIGDERVRRTISGALASAERARLLVQRLLAFARRQPLKAEPLDIAAAIEGMSGLIASTLGPRIRLRTEIEADLPPAVADANQIDMALLNLAVNARDAMPDGGELVIAAAAAEADGRTPAELAPGRYVRLAVSDTGIGMDAATLARCVEPFFSTKGVGQGTGLGLSMVHGLVAQLGGGLRIASRPSVGTSIELWLPTGSRAPVAEVVPAARTARTRLGRALVVDDEALVRASTAEMLEELGYEVVDVASAEEALERLGAETFDLLVTDHLMPSMTGTELAWRVRDRYPDTRILIVSGYADVDDIAPEFRRLTKPFRQADLDFALAGGETVTERSG